MASLVGKNETFPKLTDLLKIINYSKFIDQVLEYN